MLELLDHLPDVGLLEVEVEVQKDLLLVLVEVLGDLMLEQDLDQLDRVVVEMPLQIQDLAVEEDPQMIVVLAATVVPVSLSLHIQHKYSQKSFQDFKLILQ